MQNISIQEDFLLTQDARETADSFTVSFSEAIFEAQEGGWDHSLESLLTLNSIDSTH